MSASDSLYWIAHDWIFPFPFNMMWVIVVILGGYEFLMWFSSSMIYKARQLDENMNSVEKPCKLSANGKEISYYLVRGKRSFMDMLKNAAAPGEIRKGVKGGPIRERKGIRTSLIYYTSPKLGDTLDIGGLFGAKVVDAESQARANQEIMGKAAHDLESASKLSWQDTLLIGAPWALGGIGVGVILVLITGHAH